MVERQGRSGRIQSAGKGAPQTSRGGLVRCAIYTRKSSEEGLEQEFNSLDAQREACEAYVRSQKHEGWQALPQLYDDPGYSGGNMDRPALKRLLADIAANARRGRNAAPISPIALEAVKRIDALFDPGRTAPHHRRGT